jgi:spore coat protein U-like protein
MKKNTVLSFLALLPLFALAPRADGALTCTFGTVGVNFGLYDVFQTSSTKAEGWISYSCTDVKGNKRMTIELSAGSSGTFAYRTLGSGSNFRYNLYLDSANSRVWGDTTGNSDHFSTNPNDTNEHKLPVYGTIPAGQDVGVGDYIDTIIVTMEF